jgi:cellulose 1,4-beta-cellobiosidase
MTLTGFQVAQLQGNTYHLQANEWGSSAPFSITTDGCPDFRIATSQINKATNGPPGAYPSLYKGCHWGNCTANSGLPRTVTEVETPGTVTTSATTTTVTTGVWSSVYDIWWHPTSTTSGGGQLEMMIWLTKLGSIQPAGAVVARNVAIGGQTYDVWKGGASPGGTASYVLTSPTTSITNLDLGPVAADAASRGYMNASWFLISVEFGFEPWQGGVGLAVDSFRICTPAGC